MTDVVFLGPPGSGKGTQASILAASRGLVHLSTGDALRQAIASGSTAGRRIAELIDAGNFVPDDAALALVVEGMDAAEGRGLVLDGFPRTLEQARMLHETLSSRGRRVVAAFEMEVPDATLSQRITDRAARALAEGGSPRPDDDPKVFLRRMENHRRLSIGLTEWYRRTGVLRIVVATASVTDVATTIAGHLEEMTGTSVQGP